MELSCLQVAGAKSYLHKVTITPLTAASQMHSTVNTLSKNIFAGLGSGKEYACRVAVVGVKKQMMYSPVVTKIVT